MADVKSDIEIARAAQKKPIMQIGAKLGIPEAHLLPYGHDKAKISAEFIAEQRSKPNGKLILVTAINPTPAGEGKTTTTVGLGDGLNRIGKKAIVCIREASLGPCFGVKGGAAGGGYAQVVPMEDMNLHFTGDFHAITSAHNLLSALIDNHIYWGNEQNIDIRRVAWRRVMDMNDRALREIVCIREASLGPCFGVKGGAAGGGYAQVVPMEDMNLHFTGDFHAITSAHNLLSALIDNHIYWGNEQNIDIRRVAWRRVMDMNDRALREIVCSLGGVANGYPREAGFDITVASEVMAILCLSTDLKDLEKRLGNIIIAYRRDKTPVFARDIKADGAMTVLLKDAMQPNLVQTLENNPAFVHGGPFA
ncbi:MAG: hypothetical protein RIR97_1022, partial [Pseudomonadota bacterium]